MKNIIVHYNISIIVPIIHFSFLFINSRTMGWVDIRWFLAWLWFIIFGMNLFEQALKILWGNKVKWFLEKYTSNRWASLTTGFTATSLLNSSTLVTLLTIAFVGAGVMQLYNAIGVILGANIWSATWAVLIAFLGFWELKISVIAMPLIALGWCSLIFVKQEKYKTIAHMLIGFWLLFLWISFMKESVEALQAMFDLGKYKDMSLRMFWFIGIAATAVLHSSGALGIMTLAALDGGIISFPASVAINMGANIGTTFTAFYASLGWRKTKRQVAMSHVLFNLLSSVIGVVLFWQYIRFTNEFLWFGNNLVVANAVLNFIFNLTTAVLFACFLKTYTKFIEWIIPHDAKEEKKLHIESSEDGSNSTQMSLPKLYALQEDTKTLIDHAFLYNSYVFAIHGHDLMGDFIDSDALIKKMNTRDKEHHIKLYHDTKIIADKLLSYTLPLKQQINGTMIEPFSRIERSINDSLKSIKSIKNIYRDIQNLAESNNPVLQDIYKQLVENSIHLYRHIAIIIDRHYDAENLEELSAALEKIKLYHSHFVDELSNLASKKKLVNEELSTLLNIDHYLFQSAHTIVEAVHHMYLTEEEAIKFQNLSDMEE